MLGRDAELAALSALLAEVAGQRARVAFVEGEAGIGKSRLLAEAITHAKDKGYTVLEGCAHEFELDRPFGPIIEALGLSQQQTDPYTAAASLLLIGAKAGTDTPTYAQFPALHSWPLDVVRELLERLATRAPVLLTIEDLHWADLPTLLLIDHLARRLGDLPVAVLATLRPPPDSSGLERIIENLVPQHALRLSLDRLDEPAVGGLVAAIIGAVPGPGLLALVRRAAGNPFFVTELIAALLDTDNLEYEDSGSQVDIDLAHAMLLPSLQLTILRRVGPLSGDVLEVLRVASVLGSPFSLDDLAVVLAAPASDLLPALEEPMRARLVLAMEDRLTFRHELVREAVYYDLPQAARKALHLQAARRLAAAGRSVSQVATHFVLGASPGDAEAVDWLQRAARDAVSRAPQVAVQLLDRARGLCDEQTVLRDALDTELGVALMWSGRTAEGEARLRDLLDRHHDQAVDAPARLALGQALLMQGHADAAVELLEGAGGTVEQPQLLAEAALARLARGEVEAAVRAAERARDVGHQLGDDAAVCLSLCVESAVVGLRGHTWEALLLAERALDVATRSPAREARRHPPQLFLGMLLIDLDRPQQGQQMLETARRVGEDLGMVWDLSPYHLFCGLGHFHLGDYDNAAAEAETSIACNRDAGTRINVVWARAVLALVSLQRGDLSAARRAIEAGEQVMAEIGPQMRGTDWLMWARGLLEECSGNTDTALAILRAVWNGHAGLGITSERRQLGPDLVRLCLLAGDADGAHQIAQAVAEAAQLNGSASAHGAALRCRGLARGDAGILLESVAVYRDAPRRMEYGFTCEDAGVALARAGRRDEARTMFEEALAAYQLGGAARPIRRVTAALRSAGIRRGARGPRGRPATGWEALTRTELEVSRLAATGLTNPAIGERLFISRRTVETHLSHAFTKLGVSSRIELATQAARRGA